MCSSGRLLLPDIRTNLTTYFGTGSTTDLLFLDDRIDEVAQVVFVRKRLVKVQYLRATISDEQRQEFATLVDDTVRRIESGLFLPHSGIRFPQNPCTTCSFIGLCLDKRDLVEGALVRKPGVDLGLFDELVY